MKKIKMNIGEVYLYKSYQIFIFGKEKGLYLVRTLGDIPQTLKVMAISLYK